MKKLAGILLLVLLSGCSQHNSTGNPHIMIYTGEGDIEVELYPSKAPKTVAGFLSYIDSGFYNNSSFYRVVLAEGLSSSSNAGLIQGGTWQTADQQHKDLPGLPHESTKETGLSHTSGVISLARTTPGTANTEFFICIGDQTQFDHGNGTTDTLGFAAFGKVVNGMAVVRKIQQREKTGEHFTKKIIINKIQRL